MLKAIKIRIYPNSSQKVEMNKLIGCARFAFNFCLGLKIEKYQKEEKSLSRGDLDKILNALKKDKYHLWLGEAHSKVLQQSLIDLESAYKNFFKNGFGFPKFKSKNNQKNSCRFPVDAISGLNGNRFNLTKKLNNILFKCSVRDEKYLNKHQDKIKSATLSKTKSGKYFLSVLIDNTVEKPIKNNENIIGIDLGIKDFIVCSDGKTFENIKIQRNNSKKLTSLNRNLSKKGNQKKKKTIKSKDKKIIFFEKIKKKSEPKNKEKARIKLAKFNEKLNNKKEYYLHRVANQLLNENQVIVIEDLKVKNMMKNHNLARSIQELSISKFISILEYKAKEQNKFIIKVDRFFPSSKLCNVCGYKNKTLKLKDREWLCPECNTFHDRDLNAAINIKKEGLRIYNQQINDNNDINDKIGLSKSEYTPVENVSVDDKEIIFPLKSTHSTKQEDKSAKIVNENKERKELSFR